MCGKADPHLQAQVDEILAQNKKILEMNEALLHAIVTPPQFVQADLNIDELIRSVIS